MKMGLSAAEWRAMTPRDWFLSIAARNEMNGGDVVAPPSREEYEELVASYG